MSQTRLGCCPRGQRWQGFPGFEWAKDETLLLLLCSIKQCVRKISIRLMSDVFFRIYFAGSTKNVGVHGMEVNPSHRRSKEKIFAPNPVCVTSRVPRCPQKILTGNTSQYASLQNQTAPPPRAIPGYCCIAADTEHPVMKSQRPSAAHHFPPASASRSCAQRCAERFGWGLWNSSRPL